MDNFLRERSDMLRVQVHELGDGRWDVCLRIDGTYSAIADGFIDRADLLRFFAEQLRDELGAGPGLSELPGPHPG